MAQLNVREKRLETKIAFVGPAEAGKGTNLEYLSGGVAGGADTPLFWTPRSEAKFRDCTVRVELVTSLDDADGVVFVADADPEAQSRNKESAGLVRAALQSSKTSLVVQVNKTDLPNALAPADIIQSLDLGAVGELPMVPASARSGLGVVETMELALATVLERLGTSDVTNSTTTAPAPALPREGNPLLTALRQVLKETVASHVAELETRLFARVEGELRVLKEELESNFQKLAKRDDTNQLEVALRASASQLRKNLETTTKAEYDKLGRSVLEALATRTDALATRTDALTARTEARTDARAEALKEIVNSLAAKDVAAMRAFQQQVDQRFATVLHRVEAAERATSAAAERDEARGAHLQGLLTELIEELKKPKKGWFA